MRIKRLEHCNLNDPQTGSISLMYIDLLLRLIEHYALKIKIKIKIQLLFLGNSQAVSVFGRPMGYTYYLIYLLTSLFLFITKSRTLC